MNKFLPVIALVISVFVVPSGALFAEGAASCGRSQAESRRDPCESDTSDSARESARREWWSGLIRGGDIHVHSGAPLRQHMNDQAFWSAMIGDTSAAARQATIKPASMSGSKNANGSGRGWDEALCDTYFCALRLLDAATDASGDKDSAEVAVKSVLQTVEHLRAAAERGEAGSMNQLGIAYAHGRGVQQDRKQAVEWYLKAAEKGNVTAMLNLGWAQLRGHGVARDDKQAVD